MTGVLLWIYTCRGEVIVNTPLHHTVAEPATSLGGRHRSPSKTDQIRIFQSTNTSLSFGQILWLEILGKGSSFYLIPKISLKKKFGSTIDGVAYYQEPWTLRAEPLNSSTDISADLSVCCFGLGIGCTMRVLAGDYLRLLRQHLQSRSQVYKRSSGGSICPKLRKDVVMCTTAEVGSCV